MAVNNRELYEAVQQFGGIRAASRELGIPKSTISDRLKNYSPDLPEHAALPTSDMFAGSHVEEEGVETINYCKTQTAPVARYILTSAQNNCQVHAQFLKNLQALAKKVDAQILIGFTIYDKAGYRGLVRKGEHVRNRDIWWDKAVMPYAMNKCAKLAKRFSFCGELDIIATAQQPLSSLESYCGRSSIAVPHNKFQFKCVESRHHQMPKEMYTTGSVTKKRFVQRKAGQLAQFHHVLGALLVEVTDDGYFYVHHLNAEKDGSFYWLNTRVENGKTKKAQPISGLILGDIHAEKFNWYDLRYIGKIIQTLRPADIFVHDLLDFRSRNHHNIRDPFFRVSEKSFTVRDDLLSAGTFLHSLAKKSPDAKIWVVASNHDAALARWIKETDWRTDAINAYTYLSIARHAVKLIDDGLILDRLRLLRIAIEEYCDIDKSVTFLHQDESIEVEGIECGIHGHIGPNGARGNPRAYSRLGFKTFTAHTHTPSINDGCYTVGVSGNLDMGYNKGPSKWMHCHGIIYPNGKRAFLFYKNDKWRA